MGGYPDGLTQAGYDRAHTGLSDEPEAPFLRDLKAAREADEHDLDLIERGVCLRCSGDVRGRYQTARYNCRCDTPRGPRFAYLKSKYGGWKYYRHLFEEGGERCPK